jgi:hypothetical protein
MLGLKAAFLFSFWLNARCRLRLLHAAPGVDPDITLQDAYAQIPRISNAAGISTEALTNIVDQNQEGTLWIIGSSYVNVLRINLELIRAYPGTYGEWLAR